MRVRLCKLMLTRGGSCQYKNPSEEKLTARKKRPRFAIAHGFRRRPILPGRFQPSTFSVLRLNFCVRDGNRWDPQAIITGNISLSTHLQNRTGLTLETFVEILSFRPKNCVRLAFAFQTLDQALDRLVSSSSTSYGASTDDLSTSSSLRGLTHFCDGNLILQGGFTLRCLQRLSRPHFASQLCTWQYNCCTRGASIPVLSY